MGCGRSKESAEAAAGATGQQPPEHKSATDTGPTSEERSDQEGYFNDNDDLIVTVVKRGDSQTLGMTLTFPERTFLFVKALKEEGLVPSWNANNANNRELQILEGDHIIAVNGVSKDCEEMMKQLKEKTVQLTVKRVEERALLVEERGMPSQEPVPEPATAEPATEPPTTGSLEQVAPEPAASSLVESPPEPSNLPADEAPPEPAVSVPAEAPQEPTDPSPGEAPLPEPAEVQESSAVAAEPAARSVEAFRANGLESSEVLVHPIEIQEPTRLPLRCNCCGI